jgi:hypothetical protein
VIAEPSPVPPGAGGGTPDSTMNPSPPTIPELYARHELQPAAVLELPELTDPAGGWLAVAVRFGWQDAAAAITAAADQQERLEELLELGDEAAERVEQARLVYQLEQARRLGAGQRAAVPHRTLLERVARDLALVQLSTPWLVDELEADPVDAAERVLLADLERTEHVLLWASACLLGHELEPAGHAGRLDSVATARRVLRTLGQHHAHRQLVRRLAAWRSDPITLEQLEDARR